jgi:rare lipoprotein A
VIARLNRFSSILILISLLLLSGCATTTGPQKDGPPDYSVDETKIPDAVPTKEALSQSGNVSSYQVRGKRYYTLKSSKHYEERGTATWYGREFHAKRTSSGERYNLAAMTAAHKTLPLPTYVQVSNLDNGRKIIVKINDRGPFSGHHLIDLSYVAAKKLGMIGHGSAHVIVKAIDPEEYNSPVKTDKTTTLLAENTDKPVKHATRHSHRKIYAEHHKNHHLAMAHKVKQRHIIKTALNSNKVSKHSHSIRLTHTRKIKNSTEA